MKRTAKKARAVKAADTAIPLENTRDMIFGYLEWAARELTNQHKEDTVLCWIGERFEIYLSGQAKSLDEAFRLNPRRGAPATTSERDLKIAITMIEFRGFPTPIKHRRGAILEKQMSLAEEFGIGSGKIGEKGTRGAKAIDRIESRYKKLAEFEIFKKRYQHIIDFRKAIFDKESNS